VSATVADAPAEVEVYSAAETAGIETEGSSVTRTRYSVSTAARPCVSMPMLDSVIEGTFISDKSIQFRHYAL